LERRRSVIVPMGKMTGSCLYIIKHAYYIGSAYIKSLSN
jgi:hypothetical protein